MEIIYHHDPHRNFGDDLNAVLWEAVLHPRVLASDRIVLVGIGSILNEEKLGHLRGDRRQVVVLGTGVSYGLPPREMANWHVDAVRGPISAQLIGRPEASVTDGAALVARAPSLVRTSPQRRGVIFIPHHSSLHYNDWASVCGLAGIDYVSPRDTVENVLAAVNKAELVVTEAMHGAIIADSLRVPWVPVVASAAIDELKWRDWTRSLKLPFEPLKIPPSTSSAASAERWLEKQYRRLSVEGTDLLKHSSNVSEYQDYLARRRQVFLEPGPSMLERFSWKVRKHARLPHNQRALFEATAALQRAARSEHFLSADSIFAQKLEQLEIAAYRLESLA